MKFVLIAAVVFGGLWWYAHSEAGPSAATEPSPYNHAPTTQEVLEYARELPPPGTPPTSDIHPAAARSTPSRTTP